ncbi:hypothetical protein [Enemella sp. A6]|uniref:hypothetical protein n=1 Tax=Enemella sp. A6 TaxID=3440152 RepID=UPI003EB7D89F
MDAPAPRRAIDVPRSALPRRAMGAESSRAFPLRRMLVGSAVALGMVGGGIAIPYVDAPGLKTEHVETVAAPHPKGGLPDTPPDAAPSPHPEPPISTPATKPSTPAKAAPAGKPTAPASSAPKPAAKPSQAAQQARERASRQGARPAAPVAGIVSPCTVDQQFPEGSSMSQIKAAMEKRWGLKLIGPGWEDPQYLPVVKVIWQTLDAVDCTPYLDNIREKVGGPIRINADNLRGYAWGDWGLSKPSVMSVDFAKMYGGYQNGDVSRISRVFIHELAHVHNVDRGGSPKYWREFNQLYNTEGSVAEYDKGKDITETYAESVAHYVVRCSTDNPYSTPGNAKYYDFVRKNLFNGREFGPTSGQSPTCG